MFDNLNLYIFYEGSKRNKWKVTSDLFFYRFHLYFNWWHTDKVIAYLNLLNFAFFYICLK